MYQFFRNFFKHKSGTSLLAAPVSHQYSSIEHSSFAHSSGHSPQISHANIQSSNSTLQFEYVSLMWSSCWAMRPLQVFKFLQLIEISSNTKVQRSTHRSISFIFPSKTIGRFLNPPLKFENLGICKLMFLLFDNIHRKGKIMLLSYISKV